MAASSGKKTLPGNAEARSTARAARGGKRDAAAGEGVPGPRVHELREDEPGGIPPEHLAMVEALLDWFGRNMRPLPWRREYDPYHVWISEIMLQQTQMDRAVAYFERWMRRFPTLRSVAEADPEVSEAIDTLMVSSEDEPTTMAVPPVEAAKAEVPSSRLAPLKRVPVAMVSICSVSSWNSASI